MYASFWRSEMAVMAGASFAGSFVARSVARSVAGFVVSNTGHGLDVDDARPGLHHAGQQREVLAERVPLELTRQVDVPQTGVPDEVDAEHLPRLALVPVGARVHLGQ